jgi:hypothetical protein
MVQWRMATWETARLRYRVAEAGQPLDDSDWQNAEPTVPSSDRYETPLTLTEEPGYKEVRVQVRMKDWPWLRSQIQGGIWHDPSGEFEGIQGSEVYRIPIGGAVTEAEKQGFSFTFDDPGWAPAFWSQACFWGWGGIDDLIIEHSPSVAWAGDYNCTFWLFGGGRELAEGWLFVRFDLDEVGDDPCGLVWHGRPGAGDRDISFSWELSGSSQDDCYTRFVGDLILAGPPGRDWREAFSR